MATETITINVTTEAAQVFRAASLEERHWLETFISKQLLEALPDPPQVQATQPAAASDPIFLLGSEPIVIDVTDASVNLDQYLYQQ